MPPDQPDKQSRPSKRHRRSRSFSMPGEVIHVSDSSEPENSSSRKHDRQEKDSQAEGPNKRHKQNRGSEPPMRKDTNITPKASRKKSRKQVDHHKASRTSNHQQLKEMIKALETELASVRQAHSDTDREHQADIDWHAKELKRLKTSCNKQAEELRDKTQMVETEREESQTLRRKLKDAAHDMEALQLSCRNKDEELKGKEEVIAAKQKELDDSNHRSTSFEKALAEKELALSGKDELIAATQKELNDSKRQSTYLEKSLSKANLTVKSKDEVITGLQKELDDNKRQSAYLEKSLAEMVLKLEGKDEVIATKQKELDNSEDRCSALENSLGEKDRALKAAKRDQLDCQKELALTHEKLRSKEVELDQKNNALEKSENEKEALYVVNESNGHRNHNIRSREKKAKDAVKSMETEHKDKATEFEAEKAELQNICTELQAKLETKEDEQNQMIAKFQLKLKELRPQSQRYNYKEPDEKIKKDFANLESNIRQFVDKYARPVLDVTDQELENVWPKWSPELRNFLGSPLLCNQVIEAYVWERLIARVFAPGSNIWAGELGQSMEKALRMAADETAYSGFKSELYIDFQYLRSSSSSLIRRLNCAEFRPKYFDSDVLALTSTLAKLFGLDGIDDSMKQDAMRIFKDARDFEIQLRMLKATYTIRMHKILPGGDKLKHGFHFFDAEMDDRSPSRSEKEPGQAPLVDFIMRPGLCKRGNNSGANYDTKTCLVKLGVVCNAKEFFLKSRSSTPAYLSSTRARQALSSGEVKQESEGSTSRNDPSSAANKAKKGSSANPFQINAEDKDTQDVDELSSPGTTCGSPAPKARDAARTQSGTTTNMRTRSRASSKTDSNVHDGKSSTKSTNNHPFSTGVARGRGGGSSAKRTRYSKGFDPDADYVDQ